MNKITKFLNWLFGVRVAQAPGPKPCEHLSLKEEMCPECGNIYAKMTLQQWLDYWKIPRGNIFIWIHSGFNPEGEYNKFQFAEWYKVASDHKEYAKRLSI